MPTYTRWYVNLAPNMSKRQGSFIRLVATISPSRAVDADCNWEVTAAGGNTNDQYLTTEARARYENGTTSQVRSGTDRFKFKNTFHLPHAGGDKFRLSCHLVGAPGNKLFTERYVTWRKIYYTLHYMNDECKRFFDRLIERVKAVFERANIALVEYKRAKTLKEEDYTLSNDNVRLLHLYRGVAYPFVHKPHHMRVVVVNDVYDTVDLDLDVPNMRHDTNVRVDDVDGDFKYRYRFMRDGDDWLLRMTFGEDYGLASRWRRGDVQLTISEHAPADGPDPRPSPRPYPASTYQLKDHATLSRANRRIDFRFKSSGPTRAIFNALTEDERYGDRQFRFEFETCLREHYCGHMSKNVAVIRINEEGTLDERLTTVLQTLVHEMGHGFQQVVRRERLYDGGGAPTGWDNNAQHYTDHGGEGPHCNLNAVIDPTEPGDPYIYDTTSGGDLCVMFHEDEDHVDANGHFCAECEARLKRVDLGPDKMKAKGWDRSYD